MNELWIHRVRCPQCMECHYRQTATRKAEDGWTRREYVCLVCGHPFAANVEPKKLDPGEQKIWHELLPNFGRSAKPRNSMTA